MRGAGRAQGVAGPRAEAYARCMDARGGMRVEEEVVVVVVAAAGTAWASDLGQLPARAALAPTGGSARCSGGHERCRACAAPPAGQATREHGPPAGTPPHRWHAHALGLCLSVRRALLTSAVSMDAGRAASSGLRRSLASGAADVAPVACCLRCGWGLHLAGSPAHGADAPLHAIARFTIARASKAEECMWPCIASVQAVGSQTRPCRGELASSRRATKPRIARAAGRSV